MFIAKLDHTGTLQWSDTYDGPDGGADIGFSLTSDPGFNNIYIAGTSWTSHNHWDMLVCKYSSLGVWDWLISEDHNNGYDGAVRLSYFPSVYAFVDGLWQLVTDEHVSIIALSYDSVMYDLNTVSTNVECDSGNIISSSISSVLGTNPDLQIRHIIQDHLGNVYATGSILNIGTSNIDLFNIKMNPSLSLVWSSTYDGPESLTDAGHMLSVDSMGNVYIAGYTTSSNTGEDLLLVKFDSFGSLEWTRKFDGGERKNGQADLLTFMEEGHLALSGWVETSGNMGVMTLTCSSNGEILWMASHDGGLDINKPTALSVGADQSLFVTYLSGVSGFGMSACSTLKYTYIHRELEVDTTDTVSNHHFIKSELVVRINPKLVNTAFVDNNELSFALLSEILPDSAYDSIMSVMPYYDYEPKIFKIYDFLKSTDSISISRQGDTVLLPSFWSSFIMELPANDSIHSIADKLEELGNIVIHAHENGIIVLHNEPDDTYYSSQISLQPNSSPATKINAEGAWSYQGADGGYEVGRPEVKVCVVDGGFAPAHEDFDFAGNGIQEESVVKGGLNYQTSPPISIWDDPVANGPLGSGNPIHGTAVAGIIGAVRNNNKGIAGIAGGNGDGTSEESPGVSLYLSAVLLGGIQETVIEKAVLQASLSESLNGFGVHVINVSAGSDGTEEMIDVYQTAWKNGVVLIASRGNSNGSLSNHVQYPACLNDPWVISVGAIAQNGERREDSFYENVDVMAPGDATQVITLKHDDINDVIGFGKTSAAAPHVAGLAALILSSQNTTRYIDVPNLCGEDVEFLIERNATPINSDPIVGSLPDVNDYTGHGLIDADATIGNFRYPITRIYHSNAPTSKSFTHNSGETVSFEKNVGDFEAGVPYTAERREIVFTFEVQFDPTTEIIEFWPRYYNCVGVSDNNLISKEYHAQFDSPILGSNEITVMAVANTWYFPTLSPPPMVSSTPRSGQGRF